VNTLATPAAHVLVPNDISISEFSCYQALIERETGIHLSAAKRPLLVGRLSGRLRELGLSSFAAYRQRAMEDQTELQRLIDRISTNETRFFRESTHYEWIETQLVREIVTSGRSTRRVRAWSAGCSTGDEAYSIAMTLRGALPADDGWEVEVVGTDISSRVLACAEAAMWPIEKCHQIPDRHLKRFMLRGTGDKADLMKAGPELRELVRFQRLNLTVPPYAVGGGFDLIFCCNVLIYFDPKARLEVLRRLVSHLAPGGALFLGRAESAMGTSDLLTTVMSSLYRRRPTQGASTSVEGPRSHPRAAPLKD
jgi:chemotaxis protein methyltransferase CheR